jgi:FkbM family methyltransferase
VTNSSWNCLVVDAGARYGLHPSWRAARDICEFHLFEPEPLEAERLKIRYQNSANISVHAKALAANSDIRRLIVRSHRGLSNLDTFEIDTSKMHPALQSSAIETHKVDVDAVSVDEFFKNQRVDFLKLDAEQSDLEILVGSKHKLAASVLGIRVNVAFTKNSTASVTCSEIDIWLTARGFSLQNIEIDSRVARRQGKFPLSTKSGSLLGGDAIWTRSPNDVYSKNTNEITVIYALFLYLNGLEDIGLQFLIDSFEQSHVDLIDAGMNPFVSLLETRILSHLVSALSAGWWRDNDITDTYSKLFNKDFPSKEELYLRLYP